MATLCLVNIRCIFSVNVGEDGLNTTRRYGASVHFGVVVVELINCKCGGIVGNQIW